MKKQLLIQLVCLTSIFAFSQNLPVAQTPLNKNVILEQMTASNVVQCPPAHKLADQIAAANPGRVVLVNIHAGSYANTATPNYTTADGTAIHDFFNVFFYPSGGVQRIPHSSDLSRIATDRNNWQEQVNTVLGQASRVNVAINATIDATTRVLTVTVEVFYTSPFTAGTTHYLNVGMLQDNIESNQYGASNYPEMVQANGLYQHKHMFRGFVNAGGTWGDPIDASSSGVITKTYTYTLPENVGTIPLKLGKLSFYAFVHAGHNTVTDSEVFSTALTEPVYTNIPVATAKLTSIVNKFNACSGESITPIVNVENIGQEITSIEFSSSINGATPVTYTYNGSITTFNNVDITLPQISFTPQATNSLAVTITSVNSDSGIITTATQTKSIDIATDGEVGDAIVKVTTDRYGSEFSWKIYNSSNVVVASGGPYNDASINGAFPQADVTFSLSPDECYYVELIDSFGDGFDAGYGNGDFKVMCGSQNVVDLSTFSSRKIDDKFKAVENLGIKDNEGISNLKIYPNPSTGIYTIETNQDIKLEVYDMVGKFISKKEVLVGSSTLDLLNYADGVYLIKATNTAGDTKTYKVVKRN